MTHQLARAATYKIGAHEFDVTPYFIEQVIANDKLM
jgi:hypothetical protein